MCGMGIENIVGKVKRKSWTQETFAMYCRNTSFHTDTDRQKYHIESSQHSQTSD